MLVDDAVVVEVTEVEVPVEVLLVADALATVALVCAVVVVVDDAVVVEVTEVEVPVEVLLVVDALATVALA